MCRRRARAPGARGRPGRSRPGWRPRRSSSAAARRSWLVVEIEAHEDPRPVVAPGRRLDDAPEARLLEHRRDPDIAEARVDSSTLRIDRIGLDAGGARLPGQLDHAVEESGCDTAP